MLCDPCYAAENTPYDGRDSLLPIGVDTTMNKPSPHSARHPPRAAIPRDPGVIASKHDGNQQVVAGDRIPPQRNPGTQEKAQESRAPRREDASRDRREPSSTRAVVGSPSSVQPAKGKSTSEDVRRGGKDSARPPLHPLGQSSRPEPVTIRCTTTPIGAPYAMTSAEISEAGSSSNISTRPAPQVATAAAPPQAVETGYPQRGGKETKGDESKRPTAQRLDSATSVKSTTTPILTPASGASPKPKAPPAPPSSTSRPSLPFGSDSASSSTPSPKLSTSTRPTATVLKADVGANTKPKGPPTSTARPGPVAASGARALDMKSYRQLVAEGKAKEDESIKKIQAKVEGIREMLHNRQPYTREEIARTRAERAKLTDTTEAVPAAPQAPTASAPAIESSSLALADKGTQLPKAAKASTSAAHAPLAEVKAQVPASQAKPRVPQPHAESKAQASRVRAETKLPPARATVAKACPTRAPESSAKPAGPRVEARTELKRAAIKAQEAVPTQAKLHATPKAAEQAEVPTGHVPRLKAAGTQTDPERPQRVTARSTRDVGLSTASPVPSSRLPKDSGSSSPGPLPSQTKVPSTAVPSKRLHKVDAVPAKEPTKTREPPAAKHAEVAKPVSLFLTRTLSSKESAGPKPETPRRTQETPRTSPLQEKDKQVDSSTAINAVPPSPQRVKLKDSPQKRKLREGTPPSETSTHSASTTSLSGLDGTSSRHPTESSGSRSHVEQGSVPDRHGKGSTRTPASSKGLSLSSGSVKSPFASQVSSRRPEETHADSGRGVPRSLKAEVPVGVPPGKTTRATEDVALAQAAPRRVTRREEEKRVTNADRGPSTAGSSGSPSSKLVEGRGSPVVVWKTGKSHVSRPSTPDASAAPTTASVKDVARHHARISKADTVISSAASIVNIPPPLPAIKKAASSSVDKPPSPKGKGKSSLSALTPPSPSAALLEVANSESVKATRREAAPEGRPLPDNASRYSVKLTAAFEDVEESDYDSSDDDDLVYQSQPAYLSLICDKPLPRVPTRTSTVLSAESLAKLDESIARLQTFAPSSLKSAMKARADLVSCALGDSYALVDMPDASEPEENVPGPSSSRAVRFNVSFPNRSESTLSTSRTRPTSEADAGPSSSSSSPSGATRISRGVEVPVDHPPRYSTLSPLRAPLPGSAASLQMRTRRERSQSDVTGNRQTPLRHAQSVPFLCRSTPKLQQLRENRRADPRALFSNALGSRSATSFRTFDSRLFARDDERAKESVASKMWRRAKHGLGLKAKEEDPNVLSRAPGAGPLRFADIPPRPRPRPDWIPKEKELYLL
ncbi:hypothetical protein OH77DRAFT_1423923 [Trametes cingulata]|nr:hypothetical protein OH77DRAFT_1423923 [Trametes cingulata]